MFILLNCSKKNNELNLYTNCLFPLFRNRELNYIDLSKEFEKDNVDYNLIKENIETCLANAKISKYSIIVLYDIENMKKDPISFSTTAIINNLDTQVINKIKLNYVIDNLYMVLLDDAERDYDSQIIDKDIKKNLEFDKKGYILESDETNHIDEEKVSNKKNSSQKLDILDENYIIKKDDIKFLEDGFDKIFKSVNVSKTKKDKNDLFSSYDKNYIEKLKQKVFKKASDKIKTNEIWYYEILKKVFESFKIELETFIKDVLDGKRSIEDKNWTLADYLYDNISSYSDIFRNKIFRLNMLDTRGLRRRDEQHFRYYFKIIEFVIYLVTSDKKYVFGAAYNDKQNHYQVYVELAENKINNMLNDYENNLLYEFNKLGEIKFNEIDIEQFEKSDIDVELATGISKNYKELSHFSIFSNEKDIQEAKEFTEFWRNKYYDLVSYTNKRLRKITDKLRVLMLKEYVGEKKEVTVNELYQILDEKEKRINELRENISNNTPSDIIEPDYQIFDEIDTILSEVHKILNQRITKLHFAFNSILIFFASLILIPILRRFNIGITVHIVKASIIVLPMLIYIISQFIYSILYVKDANKLVISIEDYMRKSLEDIGNDDDKFKNYINDIYEMMMLSKYVKRIKECADKSNIDIDNFKYHREHIEKHIAENRKLKKLLRMYDDAGACDLINIQLNINYDEMENDLYCPLLYVDGDVDNYISINNQQHEKLDSRLLNLVDNIKMNDDEVYDVRY